MVNDKRKRTTGTWGDQIRSYLLDRNQRVKDHRTGVETRDVTSFLDGEIDDFLRAGIRWRAGLRKDKE